MKSKYVALYHANSYTKIFAKLLQSSWESEFGESLPLVDLAQSFMDDGFKVRISKNSESAFTLDQLKLNSVYAFHPQSRPESGDRYRSQSQIAAYAASLAASGCKNMPFPGAWGLHLSFTHGRRLFIECELPTLKLEWAKSRESGRPFVRPRSTFLLPNLMISLPSEANGAVYFEDIHKVDAQDFLKVHLLEKRAIAYAHDGRVVDDRLICSRFEKLLNLTGQRVAEVVEHKSGALVGIHPCLTIFPSQTLRCMADLAGLK